MIEDDVSAPPVSLAEAQAFVRVEAGQEEAVLAGFVRSASGLCEAFIGQVIIARGFRQTLPMSGAWARLGRTPVRSIDLVEALAEDGSATVLAPSAFAVDIDAAGDGWVKVTGGGSARRVRISGQAGMATSGNGVPEPLRHGILRLVGHLFANRAGGGISGPGGEPPAAVTALWRPFRRLRLS